MGDGIRIDLAELVRRASDSRAGDIWTAIPGKIQTYYPGAAPSADVIPGVKRPLPREDDMGTSFEDLPVIPNVPILFPRGKGGKVAITWPLEPGDGVLLVITTVAFARWRDTGEVSEPGDLRLHALGNAVAIPGLAPDVEDLSQSLDAALVIEAPEIKIGKGATELAALGPAVKAWLDALANFATHHTHPAPGGATGASADPLTVAPPYAATSSAVAAKTRIK